MPHSNAGCLHSKKSTRYIPNRPAEAFLERRYRKYLKIEIGWVRCPLFIADSPREKGRLFIKDIVPVSLPSYELDLGSLIPATVIMKIIRANILNIKENNGAGDGI